VKAAARPFANARADSFASARAPARSQAGGLHSSRRGPLCSAALCAPLLAARERADAAPLSEQRS